MNLKTSVLSLLSAALMLTTLWSCDLLSSGVNFTEADKIQKAAEAVQKHITPDMLVYEIQFKYSESSSSFSYVKDNATIVYVDPENPSKRHGIDVDLKSGEATTNSFYENSTVISAVKYKGYKVEKVDLVPLANAINETIGLLKDESITTNGLGSVEVKFGDEPSETVYSFKLQSKTGSTNRGRVTHVTYDEYSFKADYEGNLLD